MLTKEEKEALIKKETARMVRRYHAQDFACSDGCSVRFYRNMVRDICMKWVKHYLKLRKWELDSWDYNNILHKVNDEVDEWFDWK